MATSDNVSSVGCVHGAAIEGERTRAQMRAVLLDRDNTLTVDHGYTHLPEQLVFMPGAVEAVRACQQAGVRVLVVSNQAGVAKGKFTLAQMHTFNAAVDQRLAEHGLAPIDDWLCCPYHGEGSVHPFVVADHPERKPRPGLVRRALLQHGVESAALFGDQPHDVEAARRAGVTGVLVAQPGELLPAVLSFLAHPVPPPMGDSARAALRDRAQQARSWLFEKAFPLWWSEGFDRSTGLFHERIGLDGKAVASLPRRVRVQARQTFAYAAAGRLGWVGSWREAVAAGVAVLTGSCTGSSGGPVLTLNPDGSVADGRADLYDAAFVIFALAHASMALRDGGAAAAKAEDMFRWVRRNWSNAAGGYEEGEVAAVPPRRQNPHMHMLEALLVLHEATGKQEYADEAMAIGRLFEERFAAGGVLLEYFDTQWRPAPGDEGRVTEPGHQFEWCWLLHRLQQQTGRDALALARAVRLHGEVYGVTEQGTVLDEVWADGSAKTPTSRLWPYTERIKSGLACFERSGRARDALCAVEAFDGLMQYCRGLPVEGTWRDRKRPDGSFVEEASPASSFYHIVLALSELIRVAQ